MTRLLVLFFIVIFLGSCGGGTPKGIIGKKEMIPLLTDLHLADGYASSLYGDSTKIMIAAVYQALYKKYHTDSLQVRRSIAYYSKRPDDLMSMYVEIDSNIARTLVQENKNQSLRQEEEGKKAMRLAQQQQIKDKLRMDSINIRNGTYDFGLPQHFTSIDQYLVIYRAIPSLIKPVPVKKGVSVGDSLKRRDSLIKNRLQVVPVNEYKK